MIFFIFVVEGRVLGVVSTSSCAYAIKTSCYRRRLKPFFATLVQKYGDMIVRKIDMWRSTDVQLMLEITSPTEGRSRMTSDIICALIMKIRMLDPKIPRRTKDKG